MPICIALGASTAGDEFLLAPLDATYDARLELASDAGTVAATLQARRPDPLEK